MLTKDDSRLILALREKGWSKRAIACELHISKNTVRRYLEMGAWVPRPPPVRPSSLEGTDDWPRQNFQKHGEVVQPKNRSREKLVGQV